MDESRRNSQLQRILKKIPVFDGLSPSQLQKIVTLAGSRSLDRDEWLFRAGDPSEEVFVLLRGVCSILRDDGIEIARVEPVSTLGEVGIVTRRARQVGARAGAPSTFLVLQRNRLEVLLADDLWMAVTVFRNLVGLVSAKIDQDNVRAFDYEEVKVRLARKQKELAATEEVLGERGVDLQELRDAVAARVLKSLPRVLVVDDEPEVLRFFQRALVDYDVVTAEDGLQALEAIRELRPSLVIADINMPRMDGLELLKELREATPGVPVIGLSGYVSAENADSLGFDDFVLKPMKVVGLRNLVSSHL